MIPFQLYSKRKIKGRVAFLYIFVRMTSQLFQTTISTPLGDMVAIATDEALCLLEFHDRPAVKAEIEELRIHFQAALTEESNPILDHLRSELDTYFKGELTEFKTPLIYTGTDFQSRVWRALHDIPFGKTRTYKEQSEHLGDVKAIRAVASANGKNKIAIVIPCHRVIGSNGNLTGYAGGIERKRFLLDLERKFGGPKDLFN